MLFRLGVLPERYIKRRVIIKSDNIGIRGLNKGVSAVAIRQMTKWGSRFGIFATLMFKEFQGLSKN